ncbi:MAG: alanine--glyoxylate aminotransferase family protein [Candidatus Hydrogenedentes bacterium]|nr:alanine--glyoxylate aminotransferase family protein [Candidatus Hydrogenedentota bacterium]
MPLPTELNPTPRFLMGPGPSDVHPRVLRAMATPVVGHLDPGFLQIMDELKVMLREVFRTSNELTFAVSGTGSAGMETCLVNLLEPGDEAVVCVHGVFGNRMADIVERCGAKLTRVDAPWGQPIDPADVKKTLGRGHPKLVAIVHAETSTGVLQPLEEISCMTHEAGALFVVDTVTSLGGTDVRVDDWGFDAVYSGTQKCLSAPPGLSPVSFSARAIEAMEKRKSKAQSWYLDMSMVRKYWGAERVYHHTAPISSVYALYEALRLVLEEGLEARFARHQRSHELLREGLEELGFEFIVQPEFRLPMLNAVRLPAGVEDVPTRRRLLQEYNIEVGAGLGEFAGRIWRIGLMGCSSTENHVNLLTSALRTILHP